MGNKLRFANHSKKNENCTAKVLFSQGVHKIGLFATKDILKNEEILFDYDGSGELSKRFSWVNEESNEKIKNNNKNYRYNKFNYSTNDCNSKEESFNSKTSFNYKHSETKNKIESESNILLGKKRMRYLSKNDREIDFVNRNRNNQKKYKSKYNSHSNDRIIEFNEDREIIDESSRNGKYSHISKKSVKQIKSEDIIYIDLTDCDNESS